MIKNSYTGKIIYENKEAISLFEEIKIALRKKINLWGTDLKRADLTGADLHEADLRGANLHEADLTGADLRGSILCDCCFKKTKIIYRKQFAEVSINII